MDARGLILKSSAGVRPGLLALLPVLVLAGLWLGPEGVAIACAAAAPFLVRSGLPRDPALPPEVPAARDRAWLIAVHDRHQADGLAGRQFCLVIDLDIPAPGPGPAAAERALSGAADRLSALLGDGAAVARLAATRLAAFVPSDRDPDVESAVQTAAQVRQALSIPQVIDGAAIRVSVSAGFCLPERAPAPGGAALLLAAETAADDAWQEGPGAIRAYNTDLSIRRRARDQLQREVAAALDNGGIVAHFQPQLSTDTGRVTGFEALARWEHPDRGLIPPAEFLPVIRSAGLSARLSEVMIAQALAALCAWDRAGLPVPQVAVNLSQEELGDPQLAGRLAWDLDRHDLAPGRLCIEVLESVVADSASDVVAQTVADLARLGCGIDLDDFGTGNATLTAIRRFNARRLKIDQSFVRGVDCLPDQQRMIAAILSLADRLGLPTVAEGVETAGEHSILAQLGCTHVQGFAIARPMPLAATFDWLRRHESRLAATPGLGRRAG